MLSLLANSYSHSRYLKTSVLQPPSLDPILSLSLNVDGTDTFGNYNGTVFGNCITSTRATNSNTKSLESDNAVNSNKYVKLPDITLNQSAGITVSFWFYMYSGIEPSGDNVVIEANANGSAQFLVVGYRRFKDKYRIGNNANGIFFTPPDQWNHLVFSYQNEYLNAYVNGVKVITDAYQINNSFSLLQNLSIGRNVSNLGTARSHDGHIQEFKMWNRKLTDTEMVSVYSYIQPPPSYTISQINLMIDMRLDDNLYNAVSGGIQPTGFNVVYNDTEKHEGTHSFQGNGSNTTNYIHFDSLGTQLPSDQGFTYSVWYYYISDPNTDVDFCSVITVQSNALNQHGQTSRLGFTKQSNSNSLYRLIEDATTTWTMATNSWHHIVVSFSNTKLVNLYVDGVHLVVNKYHQYQSVGTYINEIILGRVVLTNTNTNQSSFNGYIDAFHFWNRVLTPTEVSEIS
jgi:hypothetical protein